MVTLDVVRVAFGARGGGAFHERRQSFGCSGEHGFVQVAAAHGVDDLGIGSGRRHFQVEARGECRHAVVDRSPVRNDEAVEAPLFAEYLGE